MEVTGSHTISAKIPIWLQSQIWLFFSWLQCWNRPIYWAADSMSHLSITKIWFPVYGNPEKYTPSVGLDEVRISYKFYGHIADWQESVSPAYAWPWPIHRDRLFASLRSGFLDEIIPSSWILSSIRCLSWYWLWVVVPDHTGFSSYTLRR